MRTLLIAILFSLIGAVATSAQSTINTESSKVSFSVKNMGGMNNVTGTITGMKGEVKFDATNPSASKFNVTINPGTFNTGNGKRDDHMKSDDYFNVEKFTTIQFQSTSVKKVEKGYIASGKLTMTGITKDVQLPFVYSNNKLTGKLRVKRKDFKFGPGGGFMIGKEVDVTIECVLK